MPYAEIIREQRDAEAEKNLVIFFTFNTSMSLAASVMLYILNYLVMYSLSESVSCSKHARNCVYRGMIE